MSGLSPVPPLILWQHGKSTRSFGPFCHQVKALLRQHFVTSQPQAMLAYVLRLAERYSQRATLCQFASRLVRFHEVAKISVPAREPDFIQVFANRNRVFSGRVQVLAQVTHGDALPACQHFG